MDLHVASWQSELADLGFILVPMIWRAGACVRLKIMGEDVLGCLTPPPRDWDEEAEGNFCIASFGYAALYEPDTHKQLSAVQAIKALVPIGTLVFIKAESRGGFFLLRRLNEPIADGEENLFAIQAHLASFNRLGVEAGRVVVAIAVFKLGIIRCEMLELDPWELLLESGERRVFPHVF
jgi:hypothetical protein